MWVRCGVGLVGGGEWACPLAAPRHARAGPAPPPPPLAPSVLYRAPAGNGTAASGAHPPVGRGADGYAHATNVVSVRGAADSGLSDRTLNGRTSVVVATGHDTSVV